VKDNIKPEIVVEMDAAIGSATASLRTPAAIVDA
jgi:hypothetical protein